MELTNIKKLITKNKVYTSLEKFINKYSSGENMYIFITSLYIYFIAKYKPQYLITFVKKPLVIVAILAYILYIFNSNAKIAIILTIALIFTITTEEEDVFLKGIHNSSITRPIINRERFSNPGESDDEKDDWEDAGGEDGEEAGEEDGDEVGGETDEEEDEVGGETDEDEAEDAEDEAEDAEDEEEDEEDSEDEFDGPDEGLDNYKNYTSNNFSKYGLIPKNSMNDTFKDLHLAIHNLENFINSSK